MLERNACPNISCILQVKISVLTAISIEPPLLHRTSMYMSKSLQTPHLQNSFVFDVKFETNAHSTTSTCQPQAIEMVLKNSYTSDNQKDQSRENMENKAIFLHLRSSKRYLVNPVVAHGHDA